MKQIDRIRNMNAEDLAEFITEFVEQSNPKFIEKFPDYANYVKYWLDSEVNE